MFHVSTDGSYCAVQFHMTTWFILCTVVPYVNVWFILRNVVPDMDMSLHKKWSFPLRIFNSVSVLSKVFMNWASNVAKVLLNTNKHHHTQTFLILSIFVFMFIPMSIFPSTSFMSYICDLFFIFIFILITINRIISLI